MRTDDFTAARPWRPTVAMGEGYRAALAGRWLSGIALLLICWTIAVPGAADAVTVTRLAAAEESFIGAGGNVVLVANKEAGVPALGCDRLVTAAGIRGAAALTRLDPATISAAPGGDIGVVSTTAGIWGLLGLTPRQATGAILSSSVADRLGLRDGDWVDLGPAPGTAGTDLPAVPIRITVTDTSRLGEEYAGILLPVVPGTGTTAEVCAVAIEPAGFAALKRALPAVLPSGSGQTVVGDRLVTGRFGADYSGEYRGRPLQWAWTVAGALLGLVWLLVQWVRRSADALYTTLGADRLTRLLLRGTEWMVLAVLGGLWGMALGVTTAVVFGASFEHAVTYVLRHGAGTLLTATAVVLLGQAPRSRSLLNELKDR